MQIRLPKPHPGQMEVLKHDARFKVLMCGRRWGKSLLAQTQAITKIFRQQRVAYITPTFLLAKSFFRDVSALLPPELCEVNKSDLIIRHGTGELRFFTGERLENMRGLKFHHAIIDEAPYLKDLENDWQNIVRPTLTDYEGTALFVSTPRGKDFFYSLTLRNDANWHSWHFTTYDNPFMPVSEIELAKKELPPPVFEQEYMANPQENQNNPFGIAAIDLCTAPLSTNPVVYYGIDLAKSVDYTVVVGLDEHGHMCYFDRWQSDWQTTKNKLMALTKARHGYIDSTGVGDVVTEEVVKTQRFLEGFKFTKTSKQQLMEGLQAAIHQKKIKYNEATANELKVFEYSLRNGTVKYEARNGFNDDAVMALAMAWRAYQYKRNFGNYSITRI